MSTTDDLIKWAEEVANKSNCSVTRALAIFCIENKRPGTTEEGAKIRTANMLINGGNTNEN